MFERGRLDHLGFTVSEPSELASVRDRLVDVGASSGEIRPLGPVLSVRYRDPDGFEGEINCFDPDFDPAMLERSDDVIDRHWHDRLKQVMQGVRS